MHQIQRGSDQETNNSSESQGIVQKKQSGSKSGQKPAIQAKQIPVQAKQKPVQAKQKPIQAKQAPIQRNGQTSTIQRNGEGGNDLKERMSAQYKVDLSGYKEHKDSSFPASVGASATIQGKDIHYGPGQFTEANRKHEFGHAIDNTLNGTPKGDTTIQGHNIDTTREAAADKIMNTPVQAKAEAVQMKQSSVGLSSQQPIQRTTKRQQIRDQANVGVEVELRNITISRADREWDEDRGLEELTEGGTDGVFVTDQHQGKSAIIEWASGHPPFSETHKGKDQQKQLDNIMKALDSKPSGKLPELIETLNDHIDVGNVIDDHENVKFRRNAAGDLQTQVNLEIPFENIGRVPADAHKERDTANLFSGDKSRLAKEVFISSRVAAQSVAGQMLTAWNTNHVANQFTNEAKFSLASLFTVFLHSEINDATGGEKDAQGVLFKTGAGDLVRTALKDDAKQVLWYCMHRNDNFITQLSTKAKAIYAEVYRGRGGDAAVQELETQVERQARRSFQVAAADEIKRLRWGNEHGGGAYGNTVDEDWFEQEGAYVREAAYDESKNPEWVDSRHLTGVKTGKTFDVSEYLSDDGSKSAKYMIAEVRRNDNDINELVKMAGIDARTRNKLATKIKGVQTPIKL
ncbi:hypothetical protein BKI52_15425 [marine bacterium AO1-C]|nr:hypothetical protein BKI52_15425 [marine bacterium AO1-C]